MKHFALLAATSAALLSLPATAQTAQETARFEAAQRRIDSELSIFRTEFDRYSAARARGGSRGGSYDPRYDNQPRYEGDDAYYDPSRDYRDGSGYNERVLSSDERVYRGTDGRYYCKRNDGTTGLIIGALGGGVLGNVIDGGRSRTVGTLLGGVLGAVAGRSVERSRSEVRCR